MNSEIVSVSDLEILDSEYLDNHGCLLMHDESWEQDVGDILVSYFKNGSVESVDRSCDHVLTIIDIVSFTDPVCNNFSLFVRSSKFVVNEQLIMCFPIDST